MNEKAIIVENISKDYKIYNHPNDRVKEVINPFSKNYHTLFQALKNISFTVNKGETVGILGKNGSGKSTLLKIITGILQPTGGTVKVNGKISALLELGAGFNPELTGIENIYLNGTIMGFDKEDIDAKLQEIIDFADIGEFVYQPVRMYSSGMFARLAFAVAINVDPDILIVDEALSVGDSHFQEKSFTRMKQFRKQGKSILFVSHSIPSVRNFCDKALWIDQGDLRMIGSADMICAEYQDYINEKREEINVVENHSEPNEKAKIIIANVELDKDVYLMDEDINIRIKLDFRENITSYGVGVIIYNNLGSIVSLYNTARDDIFFDEIHSEFSLSIPNNDFVRGKYYVTVSISDEMVLFPYDRKDFIGKFEIKAKNNKHGIPIADGMFRSKHKWIF